METSKYRFWTGIAFMLSALITSIVALVFRDSIDAAGWLYVATVVLFGVGGLLALDLSLASLFGFKEKPRYIYRPEAQQILVQFDSVPFMIERDGLKIRLVMTLGVPTSEKFMHVCEPEVGLDFAFKATGSDGGRELALRDGSKLYFIRRHAGIKVLWKDVYRPWKVVEEK